MKVSILLMKWNLLKAIEASDTSYFNNGFNPSYEMESVKRIGYLLTLSGNYFVSILLMKWNLLKEKMIPC